MKFYVVSAHVSADFDILVEANDPFEAMALGKDEAKKRVKSPTTLDIEIIDAVESDEK